MRSSIPIGILILATERWCLMVWAIEPHGENVCPYEEIKEELKLQKHLQTVVLHTTELCGDITQGFRCKVKNNGTKITYKGVPNKVKTVILKCCLGYFQTENATCEICPEGMYGMNCSQICTNCTSEEICDNAIGCCNPIEHQCGLTKSEFLKEATSNHSWLFAILALASCAAILLLFGTVFYRKKYMKEKDPDLPTLTYYPHVREFVPPAEIESREFNNPLYRQSTAGETLSKLSEEEEIASRNKLRPSAPMNSSTNEYATLDEVSAAVASSSSSGSSSASAAGPSSREPLLSNQRNRRPSLDDEPIPMSSTTYEMPNRHPMQIPTSPQQHQRMMVENMANERKQL